jgi:pimeloyl-ACP methyl ester carboxylesterase
MHGSDRLCAAVIVMAALTGAGPAAGPGGLVELEGGAIEYVDEGRGTALVFLSGGALDLRQWDAQATQLSRQYRIVRVNGRGWGRSAPPSASTSMARDVHGVMDHLAIDRAVIVASSNTAGAALALAAARPDRVDALALLSPALEAANGVDTDWWLAAPLAVDKHRERVDGLLESPHYVPSARSDKRLRKHVRKLLNEGREALERQELSRRLPLPAPQALAGIDAPVLVMLGAGDHPQTGVDADRLILHLPRARKAYLEGVGHMAHVERPELVTLMLRLFLRDNTAVLGS